MGEFKDGDEKGFRRALWKHKVDTVVLISDGGCASNGLELENIIYDNKKEERNGENGKKG
tara:strand:+ start:1122 stop:1301 length:180 start_codon:yes stop_codon:yes gene_type:complete